GNGSKRLLIEIAEGLAASSHMASTVTAQREACNAFVAVTAMVDEMVAATFRSPRRAELAQTAPWRPEGCRYRSREHRSDRGGEMGPGLAGYDLVDAPRRGTRTRSMSS